MACVDKYNAVLTDRLKLVLLPKAVAEVVKTFGKPHHAESLGDFRYQFYEVARVPF